MDLGKDHGWGGIQFREEYSSNGKPLTHLFWLICLRSVWGNLLGLRKWLSRGSRVRQTWHRPEEEPWGTDSKECCNVIGR